MNPYAEAQIILVKAMAGDVRDRPLDKAAGPIYSLGGLPWAIAYVPGRGLMLQKAGRRVKVSPGRAAYSLARPRRKATPRKPRTVVFNYSEFSPSVRRLLV